jgi:hypothetical protein
VARVLASTAIMALVTYTAEATSSGHGVLTLLIVGSAGSLAYAGAALLFDVAGVRSSITSLLWPRWAAAE